MTTTTTYRDAGAALAYTERESTVIPFGLLGSALSPWHAASIEYRGRVFASVAQLIAYTRAKHFQADEIASEIMTVTDPRTLRRLSAAVNASDAIWRLQLDKIMTAAIRELAAQNLDSLVELMRTGAGRIAFAVEHDRVWGTGIPAGDPRIWTPATWPGENRLGDLWRNLRDGYFAPLRPMFFDPAQSTNFRALDESGRTEIARLVESYFCMAEDLYDASFPRPKIRYDLHGGSAGQARWGMPDGSTEIRFNAVLLSENWDRFRVRTIPHEVAHLVTRWIHGPKVKAHGPEWKAVMAGFGCEISRCHNYDVTNAKRQRGQRIALRCLCSTHLASAEKSGDKHRCRSCGKPVLFMFAESALQAEPDSVRLAADSGYGGKLGE